jgi:NAD(P)-dependent dehydrogenase (short-subunit alcohol dehydrogenase family)
LENGEIVVVEGESGGIGFAVLGAVAAVGAAAVGVKIYRSSKTSVVVGRDGRDEIGQLPDE